MPVAEYTKPNKWENFPVAPVGYDEEGQPIQSGFLPATTIRGAIRRFAVLPEMAAAAEKGAHYRLERAYSELIGQDPGSEQQPDEIDLTAIAEAREESPIVDLFGSGLGVKSRLLVSNFVPDHPTLPMAFTWVRKDIGDTEGVLEALPDEDRSAYLAREQANRHRAQAEALVADLKRKESKAVKTGSDDAADLKVQLEAAEKLAAKYKEDMGDMQVSTRSLGVSYALPQGLELKGKFVVRSARERDQDILLRGLDGLSRWPVLGAQSARGAGEISGTASFKLDGKITKIVSFGGFEPLKIRDFEAT
ncbi:hypothetical protein C1J05_04075 [Sulfitobacter sp. JL08]|nr:hypothetical protein C1J05_04075 [Sulfitobacter sp. JL08]